MKMWMTLGLIAVLALPAEVFSKGGRQYSGGRGTGSESVSETPDEGGGNDTHGGGNSSSGVTKGELYGDLFIIVRDINGEPILYTWDWTGEDPFAKLDVNGFPQPIAPEDMLPEYNGLVPLNAEGEIADGFTEYTQEVELGRLNLARAPESVLEAGYQEALKAINAADEIGNDPCGRIHLVIDGEEKTIDSPRENLALYLKLMTDGYFPGLDLDDAVLGSLDYLKSSSFSGTGSEKKLSVEALNQAASLFAGAGDKGTEITLDEVIYLNNILGINDPESKSYFNFRQYPYDRERYADILVWLLVGPIDVYLDFDMSEEPVSGFYEDWVNIMDAVFEGDSTFSVEKSAAAFSTAASEALQVLTYIHDREPPEIGIE